MRKCCGLKCNNICEIFRGPVPRHTACWEGNFHKAYVWVFCKWPWVSQFTSLCNAVTQGRRIGGMSHRATCGWSHVDSGPVRSCGPLPFAVTGDLGRQAMARLKGPRTEARMAEAGMGFLGGESQHPPHHFSALLQFCAECTVKT